ncbi:prolyl 4-hydroxylase subunit alpha-1-like [Drosophila teissieri]|uniref:prolyl 4-hydroxylase subunit alpha-1-like n=1 Tax=Drosophila teissieri TaxID=7243 RepID=UPI001CBA3AF3|nr:prolyl 4-hydroxylase subunit alpha-1-like [Drosophila teissieri]
MKSVSIISVGLIIVYISYSNAGTWHSFNWINLLKIQESVVRYLDNYINALETKLDIINEALVDLATYHIQFERDKLAIASSPVGSYSLIHHMQSDWTQWQLFLQEDPGKDELASLVSMKKYLPTKSDISEVCQCISNISNAYHVPPQDIANGVMLGIQTKYLMSPRDCVVLADHCMDSKDYDKSKEWLQVALSMLESPRYQDPILPSLNLKAADLYLKLAEVYVKQQNWPLALATIEFALKSHPHNAQMLRMQEHLSINILLNPTKGPEFNTESNQLRLRQNKSLYCFYDIKSGTFYSLLAPMKAEIIFIDPLLTFYHD